MKYNRHKLILELVAQRNIETQEELASLLQEQGMKVTQATVSRDIRELNLTKVTGENGKHIPALNETLDLIDWDFFGFL